MLKYRPCAYCGRTDLARTNGHVLSKNMYPNTMPTAQRITVSECTNCKKIWEDVEPHFRNILLSIWNAEALPVDSRVESMWRGFHAVDGRRRASELHALFRPANGTENDRKVIYPAKDEGFNLILRRIVRGLAAKHGLAYAVPDNAVTCDAMLWAIPPAFEAGLSWHVIALDFFSYAYASDLDGPLHSFWLLRFSQHLLFFGAIERHER